MKSNKNTQIIDLTCKHDLPVRYSRMYDQISTSINHKYVEIIDNISKNMLRNKKVKLPEVS